jgi:carboxyl-terminal processing protease
MKIKYLTLIILLFILSGCFSSKKNSSYNENNEKTYAALEKFNSFFINLKTNYYIDINENELIDIAIEKILDNLDPYSSKVAISTQSASALQAINYNSFGLMLKKSFVKANDNKNNTSNEISTEIEIEGLQKNSLAIKLGLKEGDLITHINNQDISNLSIKEIQNKFASNDSLNLKIYRPNTNNSINYDIKLSKEKLNNTNIKAHFIQNTLFVKIALFNINTANELSIIINEKLKQNKNTNGLILDLRDNPGGLLDEAIDVSNLFLNFGLIASIPNLKTNNAAIKKYLANEIDILNNLPIVILINEKTASASEIVAGSLQDNGRAILVGENSYGKNLIQTIIPINSNDYYKITTASYILPKSQNIANVGLTPNFVIKNSKKQVSVAIDLINNTISNK